MKNNTDIRSAALSSGVRLWQVANELGIAESTFCRHLRVELAVEEKRKILAIIERLSEEVG